VRASIRVISSSTWTCVMITGLCLVILALLLLIIANR
jgi:Na+-transporting methylmalonyl-CoA/oxaloacetate decarboxylase gamma subunit